MVDNTNVILTRVYGTPEASRNIKPLRIDRPGHRIPKARPSTLSEIEHFARATGGIVETKKKG